MARTLHQGRHPGLDEARRQIDLCIDSGINLIDTANVYSAGDSEEIIGEALGGKRKGDVLIATKARMPRERAQRRWPSRFHLIGECEKSLKRLRTDVIDIYFMHSWDGRRRSRRRLPRSIRCPPGQGPLCRLLEFFGLAHHEGAWRRRARGAARFVTQQIHYTLEAREAEYELLPISVDQGLGILVWSPIAGGLLSGKHRRNQATPEGTVICRLERAADPRRGPAVEYRRCAGRDRRSARRLGRAGSARLAARPPASHQ